MNKPKRKEKSNCHVSCATCHMSCVACYMSPFTFHLSPFANANSHSHRPSLLTPSRPVCKSPPKKQNKKYSKNCPNIPLTKKVFLLANFYNFLSDQKSSVHREGGLPGVDTGHNNLGAISVKIMHTGDTKFLNVCQLSHVTCLALPTFWAVLVKTAFMLKPLEVRNAAEATNKQVDRHTKRHCDL